MSYNDIKKDLIRKTKRWICKDEFFRLDYQKYYDCFKARGSIPEKLKKVFRNKRNSLNDEARFTQERGISFIEERFKKGNSKVWIKTYDFEVKNNEIIIYKYRIGVNGGWRILHAFRTTDKLERWKELKEAGLKENDKIWRFIKQYVQDHEETEIQDYVKLGYHLHMMVFPNWLGRYDNKLDCFPSDLNVKHISRSKKIKDTINIVRYQLDHAGVLKHKKKSYPAYSFGDLYHFSAKEELGEVRYIELRKTIAEKLGYKYDEKKDELIFYESKKDFKCPKCQSEEYISGSDMAKMNNRDVMSYYSTIKFNFSKERAAAFLTIYRMMKNNINQGCPFILFERVFGVLQNFEMGIHEREADPPTTLFVGDERLMSIYKKKSKVDLENELSKNNELFVKELNQDLKVEQQKRCPT